MDSGTMRLTFVGTGVSCAIPVIGHLDTECACRDAIRDPDGPNRRNNVSLLISLPFATAATESDNNGSSAVDKERDNNGSAREWHHVLIDCGKTFRSAYLRVLAPLGVRAVDALLLTHGHADAMHCVEELCDMQAETARDFHSSSSSLPSADAPCGVGDLESGQEVPRTLRRVPTYLTYPTLEQIEMVSRDLVRASFHVGPAPASQAAFAQGMRETHNALSSYAAETSIFNAPSTVMDLFFLDEAKPQRIYVPLGPFFNHKPLVTSDSSATTEYATPPAMSKADAELPFYSFPVEHGPRYISMCFAFGRGLALKSHHYRHSDSAAAPHGSCVVYISDVSAIPTESMAFLLDLVKIDVLVLDLLAEHGAPSASHYCADEAIPMVVQLAPRKVYFVGMFCSLEHHRTNAQLKQELQEVKARVRAELAGELAGTESLTPEAAVQRAQKQRFVDETESMELAYDGQQLEMDA